MQQKQKCSSVLVASCYVALASPPRHQHLRCFHGTRTSVEQGAGAGAWTINRLPLIVTKVSNDSKLKLLRTCIVNGVLESLASH